MDNTNLDDALRQEAEPAEEAYIPRPKWQVWGARLGLVIFLLFVVLQLLQIAGGGL